MEKLKDKEFEKKCIDQFSKWEKEDLLSLLSSPEFLLKDFEKRLKESGEGKLTKEEHWKVRDVLNEVSRKAEKDGNILSKEETIDLVLDIFKVLEEIEDQSI